MAVRRQCSGCGKEIPQEPALEGLCPRCLLMLGLGATPGEYKRLGSYEILSEIGRGGMGSVYRAYESSLNRIVALKVLDERLSQDRGFLMRFVREARMAAQLKHPNIVTIHAVGEERGRHYIAMEYVEGYCLAALIREQGRIDLRHAVHFARQVASALGEAHSQGIVHRDIKPQNIMVDRAGRVRVLDFGVAKAFQSETRLTSNGARLGTPEYMAPEQYEGGQVDARTDIYALGVTLFEMITGTPPFTGDTPLAVMHQIMETPFPAVSALNPEVSPELDRIVSKMTARKPGSRYASASDLRRDLEAFMRGQPVGARESRPARRRFKLFGGLVALSVGLLVVVLLGLYAIGGWQASRTAPPRTEPQIISDFDSGDGLGSDVFPRARWRAIKGNEQSDSLCRIEYYDGGAGTPQCMRWPFHIRNSWVAVDLMLTDSWKEPIDLSAYEAVSFYIKGQSDRPCNFRIQTGPVQDALPAVAEVPLRVTKSWQKVTIDLKKAPQLAGVKLGQTYGLGFVDRERNDEGWLRWIDQICLYDTDGGGSREGLPDLSKDPIVYEDRSSEFRFGPYAPDPPCYIEPAEFPQGQKQLSARLVLRHVDFVTMDRKHVILVVRLRRTALTPEEIAAIFPSAVDGWVNDSEAFNWDTPEDQPAAERIAKMPVKQVGETWVAELTIPYIKDASLHVWDSTGHDYSGSVHDVPFRWGR